MLNLTNMFDRFITLQRVSIVVSLVIFALSPTARAEPPLNSSPITTVLPSVWDKEPSWSPDGELIAVASKLHLNKADAQKTQILRANDFSLLKILDDLITFEPIWSPNKHYILGYIPSHQTAIFSAISGRRIRTLDLTSNRDLSWSPDGERLLLVQEKSIEICDMQKQVQIQLPSSVDDYAWEQPAWSPDGGLIAVCSHNEPPGYRRPPDKITFWDSKTAKPTRHIDVGAGVGTVSWSPDNTLFLYSTLGGIQVLDATTYKLVQKITTSDFAYFSWSPKITYLTIEDADVIRICNGKTLKECVRISGPKAGKLHLEWSPNERFLLIHNGYSLAICDPTTGKYLSFKPSSEFIEGAHWNPQSDSVILTVTHAGSSILPVSSSASDHNKLSGIIAGGKYGSPGWENCVSPNTVEDCNALFDKTLTQAQKDRFMNTGEGDLAAFGGGSWVTDSMMSNVYGNWYLASLENKFSHSGVKDIRDVVEIILHSYWRYLNSKPIQLTEQLRTRKMEFEKLLPIVDENRPISDVMAKLMADAESANKDRVKVPWETLGLFSFVDESGLASAEQLAALQSIRKEISSTKLAIHVFVIPAENLSKERWPAVIQRVANQDSNAVKKTISAFINRPGDGIVVSKATPELCASLFRFEEVGKHQVFTPPQTFLVAGNGHVLKRFNSFTSEITGKVQLKKIKEILGN